MPSDRDALLHELNEEADYSSDWGRNNNVTDVVVSMMAVIASLTAAVLVSNKDSWPLLVASVAAVPAACASLQQVVAFRRRAYWHFEYAARMRALAIELRFANRPKLEEFARRRGELDIEMEKAWPQLIGAAGSQRQEKAAHKRQKG